MKSRFIGGVLFSLGVLFSSSALANVHFVEIVEVFPGTTADPTAQYVMLQMHAGGQNITSNSKVQVFDNANALISEFTFAANVPNGGNQSRILIATQSLQTLAGITADLDMDAVIPLAGGKICFFKSNFSNIDCVAWGNHPGSAAGGGEANVGTPFNAATGLVLDQTMTRKLDIAGGATTLDGGDDTNNSATDFIASAPNPINNAGDQGGSLTCGNGTVEANEDCEGADLGGETCTTVVGSPDPNGLACNADCTFNTGACVGGNGVCGNGIIEATNNEECDDENTVAGDGCDAACAIEGRFECVGEPSVCTKDGVFCAVSPVAGSPWSFAAMLGAFLGFVGLVLRRRR